MHFNSLCKATVGALTVTFLGLAASMPARAGQCEGTALQDTASFSRDEGMMISSCEYRSDCSVKAGTRIGFRAIVVLPGYDMKNLFVMDDEGRCFASGDFDFAEGCDAPVRVNEGCEP